MGQHKFIGCSEMMMIKVIEDLRQRVNAAELEITEVGLFKDNQNDYKEICGMVTVYAQPSFSAILYFQIFKNG